MKIYLVGGAVRDKLLGITPKEKDWVVVGSNQAELLKLGYKQVGKQFPVFLHPKHQKNTHLPESKRKLVRDTKLLNLIRMRKYLSKRTYKEGI